MGKPAKMKEGEEVKQWKSFNDYGKTYGQRTGTFLNGIKNLKV